MEKPHKNLRAWQLGMDIAVDIYQSTETYPAEEKFGLVSQMRRSSVSIPSNIAEGAARNSTKELINFLYVTSGSLSELDTQLELAKRLGYLSHEQWQDLDSKLSEEDKVLYGLIKYHKGAA
ncbi:MAG: four helix bundle protein [Desulfohalobiaceae bacterium]|nr:four helix bundle protein [Desulfohalobiaceae bacterium]